MSVQFGRWSFDGLPPAADYLKKLRNVLAPYGPDGSSSYSKDGVDILYGAFHTTKESRQETQPCVLESGAVITWDGRLDNRAEFIGLLRDCLSPDSADVAIAAASYERWGTRCFARLIGDWAVSIWNPCDRSLTLAKDPVGTRHLYYSVDARQITWSTVLDSLVLPAERTFLLQEEYIAGWLGMFPATHLTPYVGISSVPPSCFVHLRQGKKSVTQYWEFDPAKRIRYSTDAEYEEHFRTAFAESVRRRLRSDAPVLAELSGGMDSSSIVCMADRLISCGEAGKLRLDTVSYYDDSEPNWNERPYFAKVEEQRGRTGRHINVGSQTTSRWRTANHPFAATPAASLAGSDATEQFGGCMASQGNRVILSGIGGDEVTGGVPTPIPELADLLARVRFVALARQLKVWALNKRKPWFHLLLEAGKGFLPLISALLERQKQPSPWLEPTFVRRNRRALTGYEDRLKLLGPPPSFQENLSTLDGLRRHLGCSVLPAAQLHEKRYPYLDRNLLEFLYAVPREQLIRPGHRRSLMRRALAGIVPEEILNRKRKAFVVRAPVEEVRREWASPAEMSQPLIVGALGILDAKAFSEALSKAQHDPAVPLVSLTRTLGLESWLRDLAERGILQQHLATR